jgi:hypothetical protein
MVLSGIEHRRFGRATEALWLAAERRVRWAAKGREMLVFATEFATARKVAAEVFLEICRQ